MMLNKKKTTEKRNHRRFRIKPGVIGIILPPWPHSTTIGEVLDLSTEGLGLQYLGNETCAANCLEVSILSTKPQIFLERCPVKTVSNLNVEQTPFKRMRLRRAGFEFDRLTSEQKSHLEACITTCGDK